MLTNYLKIALRTFRRQKGYTFINVFGLALGMASCLVIALYVQHELSYDRFHEKADRIYRIGSDLTSPTETQSGRTTPGALAPALEADFPAVEQAVRVMTGVNERALVRHEGRTVYSEDFIFADPGFFEIFSFPLLRGDPATALREPHTAVLSASLARALFGEADPIGRVIQEENQFDLRVTGVMADVPSNAHLRFDMVASMGTVKELAPPRFFTDWFDSRFVTYALLREGARASDMTEQLPAFVERHMGEMLQHSNQAFALVLEPLTDIHLHSTRGEGIGSPAQLYVFGAVALFILLIAAVNFVNLATARSAERAKEVGVRKTMGAAQSGLVVQFLAEAVLLAVGAAVLALLMAAMALPTFEALAGVAFGGRGLLMPGVVVVVLGAGVVVGVLAGSYPSFVLARFRPVEGLKGRFTRTARGIGLRQGLVVFQMTASIALIAGTLVVFGQLRHMQNQRLGVATDQVMLLDLGGDGLSEERHAGLHDALLAHPDVQSVAGSREVPGLGFPEAFTRIETADGAMQETNLNLFEVEPGYVMHYGITLVAGRPFDPARSTDLDHALLLNEAATRQLGYADPADAVGARYAQWGREGEVIGVVADFPYESFRQTVAPLSLRPRVGGMDLMGVRVAAEDWSRALAEIGVIWAEHVPERPFGYRFLDEAFGALFRAEARFGRICSAFAAIAILIACMGLFGLATFTAQQRTKEIGIRKVLGASVPGIVALLSNEFLRLVLAAFVIATPIAYLAMQRWLEDFAYRIDLGPGVFVLAGALALAIALLTVSYQAIRAARTDPAKALRYE